jgi:hypothetical protein
MTDPNKYRVDRTDSLRVPCGMNSIVYIGARKGQASEAFSRAVPGLDAWNKPNPAYGVVLSVWDEQKQDYIIKRSKGL